MLGRVGVLGPEGGAEGVHVAQRQGHELRLQLPGHGKPRGPAEELLGLALLRSHSGRGLGLQVAHAEHLARALAVRAGEDGRVDVVFAFRVLIYKYLSLILDFIHVIIFVQNILKYTKKSCTAPFYLI